MQRISAVNSYLSIKKSNNNLGLYFDTRMQPRDPPFWSHDPQATANASRAVFGKIRAAAAAFFMSVFVFLIGRLFLKLHFPNLFMTRVRIKT